MKPIYYYDTRKLDGWEPAIPFSDRSVFFGDAIYDACLVKNKIPYLLDLHLDRFFSGCGAIGIHPKKNRTELSTLLLKLCQEADTEVAFLYFQASRSAPLRRHFASEKDESHLLITVSEWKTPRPNEILSLILLKDRRYEFCNLKTTNLLPAVLAATKARGAGAHEAVFVRDGLVTECAHSNISILKNGKLLTHPEGRYILSGIARKRLIFTCRTLKIPVEERPFTVKELLQADEIFITSTTKLCQRAGSLMGRTVGLKDERRAFSILNEIFTHFSSCDVAQ